MTQTNNLTELAVSVEIVADWIETINDLIDNGNGLKAASMIWQIPDKKSGMRQPKEKARELPNLPMDELKKGMARIRTAMQRLQESEGDLSRRIHKVPLLKDLLDDPATLREAATFMTPDDWQYNKDVFVLIGRHCSKLASELLRRGQTRLFCYVPDDETRDLLPSGAIGVTSQEELMNAIGLIEGDPPKFATTQRLDEECGGPSVAEDIASSVYAAMLELRANVTTIDKFGKLWVANVLKNLPEIPNCLNTLQFGDHLAGKPLVVISTGPSLTKNIDQLAKLKGKAVLVALNHSLSAMTAAGIQPDIAIALEAQDLSYHFEGFDIENVAAVVLSATVKNSLFRLPAPRHMVFSGSNMVDNWAFQCLGEHGTLASGGSVANNALSLATAWKCDPIIFVGQDLALTGGKFYAQSSVDGDMAVEMAADKRTFSTTNYSTGYKALENIKGAEKSPDTPLIEVDGYYGDKVFTTGQFNIYRRWFESAAAYYPDTRMWNCTEGGAYIEGMEHIPLSEAIERISDQRVDVKSAIDKAWADIDWDSRKEKMTDAASVLHKSLKECIVLAKRCMSLVDKARTSTNAMRKLHATEKKLVAAIQPIIFISQVQQAAIREITSDSQTTQDVQEMLDLSKRLYRLVLDAENYALAPLEDALRRLAR